MLRYVPATRSGRPDRFRVALLLAVLVWSSQLAPVAQVGAWPPPDTGLSGARLYVSHAARLTSWMPAGWEPVPFGGYGGPDGFVNSYPLPGAGPTLDDACEQAAADPSFGAVPETRFAAIGGLDGCWIEPSANRPAEAGEVGAVVVRHPRPFASFGMPVDFVVVFADVAHLPAIAGRLDFDPAAVSPAAYLESVVDLISANAYFGAEIDWDDVRAAARARAAEATTYADVYPAIQLVLNRLLTQGDRHSFFLDPMTAAHSSGGEGVGLGYFAPGSRVIFTYPNGPAAKAGIKTGDTLLSIDGGPPQLFDPATAVGRAVPIKLSRPGVTSPIEVNVVLGVFDAYIPPTGRRLAGGIGYVELMESGGEIELASRYATRAQEVVAGIDQEGTCGWIIDLRRNLGGSYFPMVSGVGSILGEGEFLGFTDAAGNRTAVEFQDGRIIDNGIDYFGQLVQGPLYELRQPMPPVVVLIGQHTYSSGEVTAIAFIGRPETRLFGQPSGGLTTANGVLELFDGAWVALAMAVESDRTGRVYPSGLIPDETVATDWTTFGTDADRVIRAASDWLAEQPACASETGAGMPHPLSATPMATP